MSNFLLLIVVFLLLQVIVALLVILRRPIPLDRVLAIQLFGTTGVAILLILARALAVPSLNDIGFVFALLASVTTIAYVRCRVPETKREEEY